MYIALDIGVKSHEESKTSVVDVFELSKNLRRDRHGIVCSLEHYNFIYQVSGKSKRKRTLLLFWAFIRQFFVSDICSVPKEFFPLPEPLFQDKVCPQSSFLLSINQYVIGYRVVFV